MCYKYFYFKTLNPNIGTIYISRVHIVGRTYEYKTTSRPSGKVYPFDLRWCTASPLLDNSHYETAYDLLMNDRNSTAMTECEIFEELL